MRKKTKMSSPFENFIYKRGLTEKILLPPKVKIQQREKRKWQIFDTYSVNTRNEKPL